MCVAFEKVNGANPFRLLTMTRQHLYAGILAAAQREGVEILTRSEAVGARPEGVLQLADGRSLPADLVIAADGVRSCVRDSLGLVGERRKYQDGIIRVLLERTDLEGGHWNHVIDFWAFTPRTLRILYAPCENGQRYFGMMAPVEAKDASTLPIDPDVWAPSFPAFAPALKLIGSRGRHDVYETTRLDTWSAGRVAIVGDAAHAMPPTLAQGACCAMMNALSLAVFVSDGSEIDGALQAVGGAGARAHGPHPSPLRGACPHARARQRHAMGRCRPARRAACPDRHPAGGVRTAPAARASGSGP